MTDRPTRIVPIALLVGTLVLAGCGVKGPLEPPVGFEKSASPNPLQTTVTSDSPGPSVTSTPTQTATSNPTAKSIMAPVGKQEEPKKKRFRQGGVPVTSEPIKPKQPFILDDLL